MEETGSAADFLPARPTLPSMRDAVQGCRGCQLYENASQAVFGEGTRSAAVMLVGEQPGDQEDRAGRFASRSRGASSSTRPSLRM
jgi:uracil-DNA glycosylase